jgi:predicted DNA-binding transcriptional regulator YafY
LTQRFETTWASEHPELRWSVNQGPIVPASEAIQASCRLSLSIPDASWIRNRLMRHEHNLSLIRRDHLRQNVKYIEF